MDGEQHGQGTFTSSDGGKYEGMEESMKGNTRMGNIKVKEH